MYSISYTVRAMEVETMRRNSPVVTYRLTSPEASFILDRNRFVDMDDLVNCGLADLVCIGYEVYVGLQDIFSAMKRYGHSKYIYPSWIQGNAQRFIIVDDLTKDKIIREYLSIKDITMYYGERDQSRYYIFITDVEYDVTARPRKAKKSEDKLTMSERTNIISKLNRLKGQVDSLIAEVSNTQTEEQVVITITPSDTGYPELTTSRHRACNQSQYLRTNGRANLVYISETLIGYIEEQPGPVPFKELSAFGIKYFPLLGDRKTIIKAITNAVDLYLKHDDRVTKPSRGHYSVK